MKHHLLYLILPVINYNLGNLFISPINLDKTKVIEKVKNVKIQ